jgi:hypothetical protein
LAAQPQVRDSPSRVFFFLKNIICSWNGKMAQPPIMIDDD